MDKEKIRKTGDGKLSFIDTVNNILANLEGDYKSLPGKRIFTAVRKDSIPEKKVKNALASLNIPENEEILVLFDDTTFGSAKDSLVFTTWGIRYKYVDEWHVSWESLAVHGYDEGKEKKDLTLTVWNEQREKKSKTLKVSLIWSKIDDDSIMEIIEAGVKFLSPTSKKTKPEPVGAKNKEQKSVKADKTGDSLESFDRVDTDITKNTKPVILENKDMKTDKIDKSGQSANIKLDKLSWPVTVVYEKDDDHEPAANLLYDLIKSASTVEPAIKTSAEYEAALFEDELLGETQDKHVIFLGKAAAAISDGIAWKYNQSGIKYGWKAKQAAFLIEKEMISKSNTIEKLLKVFISNFISNK